MVEDEFSSDDDLPEDQEPGSADETAHVVCPYCGEGVEIALDPGGGRMQQYVEDCEICCRPWLVRVTYGRDGGANVTIEAEDDGDGEK